MRRILLLPILLIAAIASADEGGGATAKVDVCHKPGAHEKTLHVSADALAAHLGHGDRKGACGAAATQPKPDDKSVRLPAATPTPAK